jgi:hypothetical protein
MAAKLSIETKDLLEIAERIVRAQGNLFIKELLRSKRKSDSKIRIGVTKDDILQNLRSAIVEKRIEREDLDNWVAKVEGWGRQHAYLFHVSSELSIDSMWDSPARLEKRIHKTLGINLGTRDAAAVDFPDELELSAVNFNDGTLEIIWRERFAHWRREPNYDEKRQIDGDPFELRAYRQELDRAVTRFVLKPKAKQAALFVQFPLNDTKHDKARAEVRSALAQLVSWNELRPMDISKVITSFDETELEAAGDRDPGKIIAQNTRFSASGASILFEADPGNNQWKNVTAVRRVRNALSGDEFAGHSALFQLQLRTAEGLDRNVTMSLSGKDRRIYLYAQMTAIEVWQVLDKVVEHST